MKHNNAVGPQIRGERRGGASRWQALLALAFLLAGLATATQYFAYLFNYHAALGPNLNGVYAPWMILVWAARWSTEQQDALMTAGSVGVLVTGVGLIAVVVVRMITNNSAQANAFLHGSARWGGAQGHPERGFAGR